MPGGRLDRQRALAHRGAHHVGREDLGDAVFPTQPLQARGGQHDGVVLAFVELAQAGIQVAAHGFDLQIGPQFAQLRRAPQRTGAHFRARRAGRQGGVPTRASRGSSRSGMAARYQAGGQLRGQVLQAVHRQVDAALEQRFFNFLGEQALGADLRQRHVGDLVAGGFDDFDARWLAQARPAAAATQCACHRASCDPREAMTSMSSLLQVKDLADGGDHVRAVRAVRPAARNSEIGPCATLLMMPRVSISQASSCSRVTGPNLRRTLSISACRMRSSSSCRLTMVGADLLHLEARHHALHLLLHDLLGVLGFLLPLAQVGVDHFLQIVDVVEEDVVQIVDRRARCCAAPRYRSGTWACCGAR